MNAKQWYQRSPESRPCQARRLCSDPTLGSTARLHRSAPPLGSTTRLRFTVSPSVSPPAPPLASRHNARPCQARLLSSDQPLRSTGPLHGSASPDVSLSTVSLSGHLFDQFLINEALDIIEAAGSSFHLVKCQVGQSASVESYSELEVSADDRAVLEQIIDSLTSLANPNKTNGQINGNTNMISLKVGTVQEHGTKNGSDSKKKSVLILGAGRVCQPAAKLLASAGSIPSLQCEDSNVVEVIVSSLYLRDAEEIVEGIPNATAVQLDVTDHGSLCKYISQIDVAISLMPPSCHAIIANACIEVFYMFPYDLLVLQLICTFSLTASYVDDSMSMLDERAKTAGVTILGEMGLDPGIVYLGRRQDQSD